MPLVGPGVLGNGRQGFDARTQDGQMGSQLVLAHLCAMISAMEIDSYWRTRSIGEAQGEGYTHLRATCPKCGRIADVPWPLLMGRRGTTRQTFLGNIPLKCQRCGNTSPIIGVRHHGGTQGYARP